MRWIHSATRIGGALSFFLPFCIQICFADVEMSYSYSLSQGLYRGSLKWKNRQTEYYWNNDVLPIVAVGYSLRTEAYTIPGRVNYQTLNKDADGLTQYRYLYPRGERLSLIPNEEETYGGPDNVTLYLNDPLDGSCPYPRYPHIVIKDKPWYGLKYPDTYKYAPPLMADDINASTGAVTGQSDYYDPAAWKARDEGVLLVSEDHHPTQLWLGMPHVEAGESINDAIDPADIYQGAIDDAIGNIQDVRGSYIAPNSPTGEGVSYTHTSGEGPGGLMMVMATSWGQEIFGYDMRVPIAIGCKESWNCVFWDSSHQLFPEWDFAGTHPSYGGGACNTDPYQITTASNIQIAFQTMPDYLNHSSSIQEFFTGVNWPGAMKTNIINATVTFYVVLSTGYYGYFSASRAHRIDEFAANAADDFSMLRIVSFGYNQGKNRPEIFNMRHGQQRPRMLTEKNLSNSDAMVGAYEYAPKIIDMVRRLGTCDNVYDWGITWGDVQDFCADLRKYHYANGIPSETQWNAMKDEMKAAFDKMKGKAPTQGLESDQISFRYNWLTMIRIMKSFLPKPGEFLPRGSAFYSAFSGGTSKIDFCGAYHPQFYYAGSDIDHESQGPLPDTNWAAEIYWIEPRYKYPSTEQGFPVIGDFPNNNNFRITADILDDGTGGGKVTARYSISPGDPSSGGQSFWRDGERTGGSPEYPVPVDWVDMDDIGASQTPVGGRRFSGIFDASGIQNETRRVYIEARDNSGYRTISWVDVFFKDDGLPDLVITADPPDGAHFVVDTTVILTVKDENGQDVPFATIYYTLDGSDPTTASPQYTGPITLAGNPGDVFVVKALAVATGYTSATGQWTYYQDAAAAWIDADPADGTIFKVSLTVTLTSNTDTILYTTDGSDPATNGAYYTGSFDVTGAIVIVRGIARGQGYIPATGQWTYYRDSDTAWISADPVDGTTFQDQLTVTLSTNADTIHYTTDGSNPVTNGSLYTGPFTVSDVLSVVRGYAFGDSYIPATGIWKYYKESDTAWVDADPGDGTTYGQQLTILLSTNADTIHYTTDGSDPVTNGILYTGPITISGGDVTVKAVATGENFEPGYGSWTYYQVTLPDVIATPPGQEFATSISVTLSLSSPWPGAIIYYTLNGPDPDETSTEYTNTPIEITETSTLRARAYASNALPSKITTEVYTKVFAIDTAWYRDADGNGGIDKAELLCNDTPDSLPIEIEMTNPFDNTDIKTVTSSSIAWKDNDPSTKMIIITMPDPFPYTHNTYFTPGSYGRITAGKYLKEPFSVKDGVAPVVDKAVFYPGMVENTQTLERFEDTLEVLFSEGVAGIGTGMDRYFNLITEAGISYYFDLVKYSSTGNKVTFIVQKDGINGVEYPKDTDSIWIDIVSGIRDNLGNQQKVTNNRRAPLQVQPQQPQIVIKALTPFTPVTVQNSMPNLTDIENSSLEIIAEEGGLLITVDFLSDLSKQLDSITCAIKVFDPVGNLVAQCPDVHDESGNIRMGFRTTEINSIDVTQLIIYWNGYNENGRKVGRGPYIGEVIVSYGEHVVKENVPIVVKRLE